MNVFLSLDGELFLFINHLPHTALFDRLALILSGVGTAGLVWFLLGFLIVFREERKDHGFFVPLLSIGAASWFIVEMILKPLVSRARPAAEMGALIVGNPHADYSFPSGHATIAFAMALLLSRKEPRAGGLFYLLAILISFSRTYLGLHYPSDVIAGSLLGTLVSWLILRLLPRPVRPSATPH